MYQYVLLKLTKKQKTQNIVFGILLIVHYSREFHALSLFCFRYKKMILFTIIIFTPLEISGTQTILTGIGFHQTKEFQT